MARLSSRALAVAVVVLACLAGAARATPNCFSCTHDGQYWCKSNYWSSNPTEGTCVTWSSMCSSDKLVSATSSCPGYNSALYQSCVPCAALSNGYWCKWNTYSSSNTDGFCATSANYCPNGYASSMNTCPDANYGSHSSCSTCTPTGYWCKSSSTAGDYSGTCVSSTSNCPAALTTSFSSGCDSYSSDVGRVLGMSIAVFIIVVVVLPVAITICLVVLCVRAARSRTVIVAAPTSGGYSKIPEPAAHPPQFYPPPPAPMQYPPNVSYYPQPGYQQQAYAGAGYQGLPYNPQAYQGAPAPAFAPAPAPAPAPYQPQPSVNPQHHDAAPSGAH